tara:strand:- start:9786 stop:9983 length:198 start_codon:yes stop_codon:yes gene_type:complete
MAKVLEVTYVRRDPETGRSFTRTDKMEFSKDADADAMQGLLQAGIEGAYTKAAEGKKQGKGHKND